MIEYIYKGLPFKPEKGCFGIASSILIQDDDKRILFDTGGYGARSEIKKLISDKRIDCVIISHLHFDHCTNLDLFTNTNIPIFISKIELDEYYKNYTSDCDLYRPLMYFINELNINLIDDEKKVSANSRIIFTPGHTLGHISLEYFKEEKSIFAGDAIKTYLDFKNINNYGNAVDKDKCIETKKKIIQEYNHIFLGHGGEIVNNIEINRGMIYEF